MWDSRILLRNHLSDLLWLKSVQQIRLFVVIGAVRNCRNRIIFCRFLRRSIVLFLTCFSYENKLIEIHPSFLTVVRAQPALRCVTIYALNWTQSGFCKDLKLILFGARHSVQFMWYCPLFWLEFDCYLYSCFSKVFLLIFCWLLFLGTRAYTAALCQCRRSGDKQLNLLWFCWWGVRKNEQLLPLLKLRSAQLATRISVCLCDTTRVSKRNVEEQPCLPY